MTESKHEVIGDLEYLLKIIEKYFKYHNSKVRHEFINGQLLSHPIWGPIAGLHYTELYTIAVKIFENSPDLPEVPQSTGQADNDVLTLKLWTVKSLKLKKCNRDIKKKPKKRLTRNLLEGKEAITLPVEEAKKKAENWESVSIDIIDDDTLRYKVDVEPWKRANYSEMGFIDKRKAAPNRLWKIFKVIAEYTTGKECDMRTPENISKDMDRICDTLKNFFGPSDRPIRYNRKTKQYLLEFNLTYKSNS